MGIAETLQQVYSVRKWDAFYNDWAMIPVTNLSREQAIKTAIQMAVEDDDWYYTEYQVYVDCPAYNTAQMIGYVEYEGYHAEFVESFG